jgi:protein TonB
LASTQQEIDRLTSELDRRTVNTSKKLRRKAINASTQEFKYATYLEAWRKKVERIGNLNYPDEAKSKKLYGNLMLHVAIKADGDVEQIRLVRSSGHKILDDAAIRIVELAAPYAPLPPDIREDVDVLDITRTWQFLSGNRLFSR